MFVGRVAVFVGRRGVRFSFVVLTLGMVMSRLIMVVSGGLVSGSGIVMMFACRVLRRLSH